MLTQWVVMVLNCNVLCHLQQCKCPDQDLWAPLYIVTMSAILSSSVYGLSWTQHLASKPNVTDSLFCKSVFVIRERRDETSGW